MSRDKVLFALELAIEQAVCEYFKTRECLVDINNQSISLLFPVVDAPFEMLDKKIIKRCRRLFARNLSLMEKACLQEKWKPRMHRVAEGSVLDMDGIRTLVYLGDTVQGVMLRSEWVPKEMPLYRAGSVFQFYVTKITETPSGVMVYVSRGSKNLPAALLKEKLPWAKIRVYRRIRGEKTWIQTTDPIPGDVIDAVRRELNGEVIEILKSPGKAY